MNARCIICKCSYIQSILKSMGSNEVRFWIHINADTFVWFELLKPSEPEVNRTKSLNNSPTYSFFANPKTCIS